MTTASRWRGSSAPPTSSASGARRPSSACAGTDGFGVDSVLECVGYGQAVATAIGVAHPGGAVGRVGVPQDETIPASLAAFFGNVSVGGGPAPVRAYTKELLPDVLEGRIEPGRVLDRAVGLDGVPDGCRAMDDRVAIKVMVGPENRGGLCRGLPRSATKSSGKWRRTTTEATRDMSRS